MRRHWKFWIAGVGMIVALLAGNLPAEARFPGVDITLWDSHQAKQDRQNPDYLKFHELVAAQKYEEALGLIDRVRKEHPQKGTPPILKSLLLYELKRYQESYELLQEGRDIQRRHPAIPFAHCRLHRHLGKVELSLQSCQIALHQHENNPDVYYEYAQTLTAMGDMEKANEALARAAELDAGNAVYHYERGMNFFYLNDLDRAEAAFKKALSLRPEDPDAGYQLGYLYVLKKNFQEAETHLNRIWQMRTSHPKVEASRQLIELIKKSDTDKLPAKTNPHQYHLNKSKIHYQAGEYGLSLFEIQTAAGLNPEDKTTLQVLVAMSSLLLHLELAEQSVRQLMASDAQDKTLQAKGYQELGDMRVMRGQMDQAREFYEKSRELGDPDGLAKISLAELPQPGPDIKPVLDTQEPFFVPAEALNRKGEVFAHYGMYQRALALYSLSLRMSPGHLMSKLNMAVAYYKMGTYHKAITLLERILISHPDHEHILSHRVLLAKAYAMKGNQERALENLKIIQSLKPSALVLMKGDPAFKDLKDHELFNH